MNQCGMMVVIQTDSDCALTAPSKTRMTSLTHILLVNFVTYWVRAFPLLRNRTSAMQCIGRHATQCGH